jgi:hypothetical protein
MSCSESRGTHIVYIDQLTPKRWTEAFGPQPSALIELEHDQ